MRKVIEAWIARYLADEEAILLVLLLSATLVVFATLGGILTPIIAAAIFAYFLQGGVSRLCRMGLPHISAVIIVFTFFVGALIAFFVLLLPLVARQATTLLNQVPGIFSSLQSIFLELPQKYPQLVSEAAIKELSLRISQEAGNFAEASLSYTVSAVPGFFVLMVYLILVPFLIFFMLKDKDEILEGIGSLFPKERPLISQVVREMDVQTANYVRGKLIEILVVGGVCYIAFLILGVQYAALLALLAGLSVIIPYIGVTVVTIPIALVGFFQWGWSSEYFWLMGVYGVIQALDGNVLVPLLFSEAVNLHPVTIILAVLVFGGVWGFWGIFFAIPLATLVKALHNAWPRIDKTPPVEAEQVMVEEDLV